jgi:hypothetical protein
MYQMSQSINAFLVLAVMALCFTTSCGQSPQSNKLIDEINAAKVKARNLGEEAERKRIKAREKSESSDREEHDRLIEEAARLYGQASDALNEAAKNAMQMANLKSPEWYEEYFSLQSKLIGNLAQLATGAHEELLARKSGTPTESQMQTWKENLNRIRRENEEFRRQISAIESRQGVVLIKE